MTDTSHPARQARKSKVRVCGCGVVHPADAVRAMYRFHHPVFAYRAVGVSGLFSSRSRAQQAICPQWGAA